ncbi:MAG: 1,4-dihydroxy-6-naphthoate synthase [Mycobacterium sp.]|nr:1,4-dihydroxy-6-naphthoate synthase [Mycobacterium sp.]
MTWTLGISPCPNDTFAFHGLVHGLVPGAPQVDVTYADIDVCNGYAKRGELDILKVSYGALPWLLGEYRLLPTGGALGRGCGPLVLTRPDDAGNPRTDLRGATVAVPGQETTAYLLFRLWAQDQGVEDVRIMPFEKIMPAVAAGEVDAGLVIHESRFTYPGYGLVKMQDLGAWWETETGHAIPLGAILIRRSLGEEDARYAEAAIRSSVELAWADPGATRGYVREHAQEMDDDVTRQHIELYVNEFTHDLGEEGYAAVEELLGRAQAAGLVPAPAGPIRG